MMQTDDRPHAGTTRPPRSSGGGHDGTESACQPREPCRPRPDLDRCAGIPRPRPEPLRAHACRGGARVVRSVRGPVRRPRRGLGGHPVGRDPGSTARLHPDRRRCGTPPPRGLRRLFAAIGSVRDGITFPLAMGLTTMGIAGLLFATVPTALAAPAERRRTRCRRSGKRRRCLRPHPRLRPPPRRGPPLRDRARRLSAAASSKRPRWRVFQETTAKRRLEAHGCGRDAGGDPRRRHGASTLLVVAATLLLAGLGLFALRWTSRRLGDDSARSRPRRAPAPVQSLCGAPVVLRTSRPAAATRP